MHGEEEILSGQRLSNDHCWRTADISWILGSESLRNIYIKQPLHHQMLFKWVSRKKLLAHPKTNSSIFSCQTRLELQLALASMVRWNMIRAFWHQTHQIPANRDIKYPISTSKYTSGSLIFWAYFSGPGSDTWHHGLYQIPRYKKSKPDCLCKKSYNGPCLDLPSRE